MKIQSKDGSINAHRKDFILSHSTHGVTIHKNTTRMERYRPTIVGVLDIRPALRPTQPQSNVYQGSFPSG